MPSVAEFRAMQEHLSFKERERVKSKATAESLNQGEYVDMGITQVDLYCSHYFIDLDFGQLTKDLMNVQEVFCILMHLHMTLRLLYTYAIPI